MKIMNNLKKNRKWDNTKMMEGKGMMRKDKKQTK